MDDACCLRGQGALLNGPGAGLFRADGEIGLQAQKGVTGADQAVKARFVQAHFLKEHRGLVIGKLRDFFLDLGGNHHGSRTLRLGHLGHAVGLAVAGRGLVLFDIADEQDRLGGQ